MARRKRNLSDEADVLLFTAHGTVQVLDRGDHVLWSSDDDDDFTDEFGDEFLEEEDAEDILAYLVEQDLLAENDELDMRVDALNESDSADLKDTRGI